MPTNLGTIGAMGAQGGQDALDQILAAHLKAALQAKADAQQEIENKRAEETQRIQREQLASAQADRELARRDRLDVNEGTAVAGALDDAGPRQDMTALADQFKTSTNPLVRARLAALKPEGTTASLPTMDLGATTAAGDRQGTGVQRGAGVRMLSPKPTPKPEMVTVQVMENGKRVVKRVPADEEGTFEDQPPTSGAGAAASLTPEDIEKVERAATAVLERRMSPDEAARYYGGMGGNAAAIKRAIPNRVLEREPAFNMSGANAGAKFASSPATQNKIRYIDNLIGSVPFMREIVKKAELGGIPAINGEVLAARQNIFGSGDVASYNFMTTALADEFAQILAGGTGTATSDAKVKLALDALSKDMTPKQWSDVLDTAIEVFALRRASLTKDTFMDVPKPGEQPRNNAPVGSKDNPTKVKLGRGGGGGPQ